MYRPDILPKIKVTGIFVDESNTPYRGALISAQVAKGFAYGKTQVNSIVMSTVTNGLGRFELDLVPSELDATGLNYYKFEVVYDRVLTHKLKIPLVAGANPTITFSELVSTNAFNPDEDEGYILPCKDGPTQSATGVTLSQIATNAGGLGWVFFTGDGVNMDFTAPGEVYFVILNGIGQSGNGGDFSFINTAKSSIRFTASPFVGDLIGLMYQK